jgi:hypothetical protein
VRLLIIEPFAAVACVEGETKFNWTDTGHTKLCGFSPQANYTDRATAACPKN